MTCDFCVGWSPSQWEAFAKKRSYKERKSSRPSGSLPPATVTSPRAGTSSEVLHPEASSSSSSLPSGGQAKRGGLAMHLVLRPVRLPLLPLDLSPARGVEVSLVARQLRASASLSPRLLRWLGRGRLLVRSGLPLPAPLPRLPLPGHHSTLCDVVSRESLWRSAPVLDPLVFPDLWIEEQGRIAGLALGQPALVAVPVVLALALLTAHGQAVESVGGRPRLDRCPLASGRSQSSDRSRSRRVRSRSRGERLRSSDRYWSRRIAFSYFRSPSQSQRADKDCQEEQSSLDFMAVVAHLYSLNGLPEASSESCKIRGFRTALVNGNQPAASYKLTIGNVSADILTDIDDWVSGMHSWKVSKLLQFQGVRSCKFYQFEGEDVTKVKALNRHVTELEELRTFDTLNKTDVIWSSMEAEETEATLRSVVEVTSWMDWWTYAMKPLSLTSTDDARLVLGWCLLPTSCCEDGLYPVG